MAGAGEFLTTQHVTIETVQVAIQCVRLGPKQMTQAVFRQIPAQRLITGIGRTGHGTTYRLIGEVSAHLWGTINYFWPQCDAEAYWLICPCEEDAPVGHVHVLYEQAGRLLRDCLLYPGYVAMVIGGLRGAGGGDADDVYKEYQVLYNTFWERHIAELPQLFIAV